MDGNGSLLSINTITEKKVNEDYISCFQNETLNMKGIVLGDGIGSHYKPELGAKFCVNTLTRLLEECKSLQGLDFNLFFNNVSNSLKKEFNLETNELHEIDANKAYGTTLICIIEFEHKFVIAYIGNGSVWHLRGNYPTLINQQRYLPWNALNVLNPHTVDEGGKEALYKFFALESTSEQIEPSVVTIIKDNSLFGDVLIASTDGLYSNDHIPVAKDGEGGLWIGGEKKIELLFNSLKEFAESENLSNEHLNNTLNSYTDLIKEKKLLDDDTTYGILYSKKAVEYQKLKNEKNQST
ncbi:serine/threonine protein phosphatase PrpC [Aquimarina sp. EL_43]|uniref:protein phosphatase 2C domain-containing protein n=1 Tax=unclassified Aquimarina TaxID=2627091 RepID=UPI0018CA272A|nr:MULTISPECIES: protein phosphatase 2C domain-containing protein [unclassified Aquimarina]MBG6129984.1 serine/threonine protein phosphatase PrpC [Aquimarina sp. EL_35]MBG6148764.1 serine/threonine protein phosphatase PrpC [Aquimarina sp. EL_32]MBG6168862.1 serine/threonine protein phosphatase PrpC [Aquimarina sp. EL_43]